MNIAIMQPYFLPYMGYFQLIAKADLFVFLDDVDYIVGGWLNRNRIKVNGEAHRFTLPLANGRRGIPIRELEFAQNFPQWRNRFLKTVYHSYHRTPFFESTYDRLQTWLESPGTTLSTLNQQILEELCGLLGLQPHWRTASESYPFPNLAGVDRICEICRREKATNYVNAPGGRSLYAAASFRSAECTLQFLEPNLRAYPQGQGAFISGLSILDLLMFNPLDSIAERAREGRLCAA